MRFLPKSLLGQVMFALAGALLVAQGISATLLYRAAEQRRETAIMNAAAFQLLSGERRAAARADRRDRRGRDDRPSFGREGAPDRPFRLPRRFRYTEAATSPLGPSEIREQGREEALGEILNSQGVSIEELVIVERSLRDDPSIRTAIGRFPELEARMLGAPQTLLVIGLHQTGQDVWQVVRVPLPQRDRSILPTLFLQTMILFVVLTALLYFVLRRITRPLAFLSDRTKRFGSGQTADEPLAVSGPQDVRDLIEAHNTMQARIGSMLDEKDVMLGAIGHDLKTPLAALRVRIESVENDAARAKMAASIEDITRTLDEILALARIGKNADAGEMTDVGALAASVVEEFEDMGENVLLEDYGRVVASVHITWLKRGLRNLVSNALRYAGTARVSVISDGAYIVLRVDDDGPGIPEDRIHEMLEPFIRGEASRNRETGGAGLGLTLARAVAERHGGTLVLANRIEGGLRAEFRLPV